MRGLKTREAEASCPAFECKIASMSRKHPCERTRTRAKGRDGRNGATHNERLLRAGLVSPPPLSPDLISLFEQELEQLIMRPSLSARSFIPRNRISL